MQNTEAPVSDYVERARELGPQLDAAAEEIELRRELPEPIVEALIERGLFRLLLPRALGGAELPPAVYVQVIEKWPSTTRAPPGARPATGCTMTSAFSSPRWPARLEEAGSSPGAHPAPQKRTRSQAAIG
jgi:alkylation response protein AidB-like acyl-CoA dehydrogenase